MNNIKPIISVLIVTIIATILYLNLPSSYYNPDGLRVFPSLHKIMIESDGSKVYQPLPWNKGYEETHYFRANVQKHFLFPIYAYFSYQIARLFHYKDNGLKPLQTANALSAAIAIGLFSLLVAILFKSGLLTIITGFGLAFSTAFSQMATNIAEVVPALPWLVLGTLILALTNFKFKRWLIIAGVCFGISASFYLVSALIGLVIAVGLFLNRRIGSGLIFILSIILSTLIIYISILLLTGYYDLGKIWHLLTFMPEQGTYGGLKFSNFVTVLLGFANSLFPILPEGFSGLRRLITSSGFEYQAYSFRIIALVLILALAVALFYSLIKARKNLDRKSSTGVFLGLLVFIGALISSLFWDPYHPKLWLYSNFGLWLIIAGFIYHIKDSSRIYGKILFVLTLIVLIMTNFWHLIVQNRENPKWHAAKQIDRILTGSESNNLILGGWEAEFCYLNLMVPEENILNLPDLILETGRDSSRFEAQVSQSIDTFQRQAGKVYFLNLFNRPYQDFDRFYVKRLGFPYFITWLETYRNQIKEIWHDEKTGISLFRID